MNTTFTGKQNQIQTSDELGALNQYFSDFKIGTLLNPLGLYSPPLAA